MLQSGTIIIVSRRTPEIRHELSAIIHQFLACNLISAQETIVLRKLNNEILTFNNQIITIIIIHGGSNGFYIRFLHIH